MPGEPSGASEATRRQRILVIEDDASIQRLVRLYLEEAGFQVALAGSGPVGLADYERERPDFVIVDLMLPGFDGWEVCERIRRLDSTPLMILTARGREADRLRGFELGADDYLTKPFSPRELVSRVRAILRRAQASGGGAEEPAGEALRFGRIRIEPRARRVEVDGTPVELRAKEFDLLMAFARAPDQALTREELHSRAWGYTYLGDSRTVDVHVGMLRKKLEANPTEPRYLKTVRRVGYRFDPTGAESDASDEGV